MTKNKTADRRVKNMGDWLRGWLAERPEYATMHPLPTDQVTDAALPDVPMYLSGRATREALLNAARNFARRQGMKNVAPFTYAHPSTLTLFEFIGVVRRLRQGAINNLQSIRTMIEEWASPEALGEHFGTPHLQALLARADELLDQAPDIRSHVAIPIGGAKGSIAA